MPSVDNGNDFKVFRNKGNKTNNELLEQIASNTAGGGGGGTGGSVTVTNFPAVQPVSLEPQPLPSGAATDAKQDMMIASLGTTADDAPANDTAAGTVIAFLKRVAANVTAVTTAIGTMSAKLPASLGIKTAATSLSVAPASDANLARETYSTVTILAAATPAAGGTAFTLFAAQVCTALDVVNPNSVDVEYQRNATGNTMTIPAGASRLIQGITNANQIGVRRVDQSTTAVTVQAEAYVV